MEKATLGFIAKLLSILAVAGLRKSNTPKHFAHLMNVDTAHSVLRVPLIFVSLLGSASKSDLKTTRLILSSIGVFYLAMAVTGSADRKVGGALPSRLTNFDIVYHLSVGAVTLWLGTRAGRMMKNM